MHRAEPMLAGTKAPLAFFYDRIHIWMDDQ